MGNTSISIRFATLATSIRLCPSAGGYHQIFGHRAKKNKNQARGISYSRRTERVASTSPLRSHRPPIPLLCVGYAISLCHCLSSSSSYIYSSPTNHPIYVGQRLRPAAIFSSFSLTSDDGCDSAELSIVAHLLLADIRHLVQK